MKLIFNSLTFCLLSAGAMSQLLRGAPQRTTSGSSFERKLQGANTAGSLLSSFANEGLKRIPGIGTSDPFEFAFNLALGNQGDNFVNLSIQSLNAIRNVVREELDGFWTDVQQARAADIMSNAFFYARKNDLKESINDAEDEHVLIESVITQLEPFGKGTALIAQPLIALATNFDRELFELYTLTGENESFLKRVREGMYARTNRYIKYLEKAEKELEKTANSRIKIRETEQHYQCGWKKKRLFCVKHVDDGSNGSCFETPCRWKWNLPDVTHCSTCAKPRATRYMNELQRAEFEKMHPDVLGKDFEENLDALRKIAKNLKSIVSVEKSTYGFDEDIAIDFTNEDTVSGTDWVGVFPSEHVVDVGQEIKEGFALWTYTCGDQTCNDPVESGTVVFGADGPDESCKDIWPLNAGNYKAVLIANNGYTVKAVSAEFTVADAEILLIPDGQQAAISVDKLSYESGEEIVIDFLNDERVSGEDWVGVYRSEVVVEVGATMDPYVQMWVYTCGHQLCTNPTASGSLVFGAGGPDESEEDTWPLDAGSYKAVLLADGGFEVKAISEEFTVMDAP